MSALEGEKPNMSYIQTRMQQRDEGGFTLIELLVVIAILAILAGVVVFAVGQSQDNADEVACETEASSILTAVEAARTANAANARLGNALENYDAYLTNAGNLQYFTVTGSVAVDPETIAVAAVGTLPGGCTAPTL
jgi:prepilin-type N-terminal cleavage/methylation domain-containing protein